MYFFLNYFQHTRAAQTLQDIKAVLVPPENEATLTFAVMGDNEGDNPIFDHIAEQIRQSNDMDFVIHLGDFSSHGEETQYAKAKETLESMQKDFFVTLGNNDLNRPISRELYYTYFHKPSYYSFDKENAHFIILDNADRKIGFDDEQLSWLSQDLQNTKADYIFLFYHRPFGLPFESYLGDDETPSSRASNERFQEIIAPYTITHIYCGHVHTYLPYVLGGTIPVTISGGAGAKPQSLIGGESVAFYHYIKVIISDSGVTQEIITVK